MVANPDEMRFASDSVDLLTRVKYAAYRRVSDLALEHAMHAGREVVTEQDVLAVLRAGLDQTATEEIQSHDAQGTPDLVEAAGQ